MTICNSMKFAVEKRLVEGKTIKEIGQEFCDGVKEPDRKIIRIIKKIDNLRGEQYLIENADKIGFTGVTQLKNAMKRREMRKDNPTVAKKKVQKIGHEKSEIEDILVQPETELGDEIKTKYMDFIRECLNEHPQDWKDIIMECIKDLEDELSKTPIEEPEYSSTASETDKQE